MGKHRQLSHNVLRTLIVMTGFLLCSLGVKAQNNGPKNFEVGNIKYVVISESDATVSAKYLIGSPAEIEIPSKVTDPEGKEYAVKSILKNFAATTGLKKITICEGIDTIKVCAFQDCSSLSEVYLPKSLKYIGGSAFFRCTSLKSISLSDELEVIEGAVFRDCSALESIEYRGNKLNKIMNGAFANTPWLNNQPEGPVYLGNVLYAYKGVVPDNLVLKPTTTGIAPNAFLNGGRFSSLTIPQNLKWVGEYAFRGCGILKELEIPSLESWLNIDFDNTYSNPINIASYAKLIIENDTISSSSKITVPETVKELKPYALSNLKVKGVIFESELNNMAASAFDNTQIEFVILRNAVPLALDQEYGFDNNFRSNTVLYVPKGSSELYRKANVWKDIDNIFDVAGSDDEMIFRMVSESDATVSVALLLNNSENSKFGRNNANNFVIPESVNVQGKNYKVVSLNEGLFRNYVYTDTLTLPASISRIESGVFEKADFEVLLAPGLEDWCNIDFVDWNSNPAAKSKKVFLNGEEVSNIKIPESITDIKPYTFYYLYADTLTMSDNVKTIGESAFYGCFLYDIKLSKNLKCLASSSLACNYIANIELPATLDSIGHDVFYDCEYLKSIKLPENLKKMGNNIFAYCYELKNVTLPSNIDKIGDYFFYYCYALESIKIPDKVKSIGESAFYYCSALKNVTLPEGLEKINSYAFECAKALQEIVLPASLKYIGYYAFSSNDLSKIYSKNPVPPVCSDEVFDEAAFANATLYVPKGSAEAYRTDKMFKNFKNIVEADFSGVEDVVAESSISVFADGGNIVIEGVEEGTPVEVFNLNGQTVYSGVETLINVADKGIYIVRVDGKTYKVAM